MVISDIIVISLSNTYSKDYMIEGAEIVKEKRFTDFFADKYPFLSACEGAVYMIAPDARNESIYDLEFLDLPEDGSLRIIWLVQDVKRSVLEIIRDLLMNLFIFLPICRDMNRDKYALIFHHLSMSLRKKN